MGLHGFQRIDDVLVQINKEMDANIRARERALDKRIAKTGALGSKATPKPSCDPSNAKREDFHDLLEGFYARWEAMAKRLHLPQ